MIQDLLTTEHIIAVAKATGASLRRQIWLLEMPEHQICGCPIAVLALEQGVQYPQGEMNILWYYLHILLGREPSLPEQIFASGFLSGFDHGNRQLSHRYAFQGHDLGIYNQGIERGIQVAAELTSLQLLPVWEW